MRFSNVPATLLHIGFLSVDPFDEELRAGAYDLLGAVCKYLNYEKSPLVDSKSMIFLVFCSAGLILFYAGGFMVGDIMVFVINLSGRIAQFAPQLTLDFISEVSTAIATMETKTNQRINCLRYMSPWIKNLDLFANPLTTYYDRSGARLRDCIRVLSDLAVSAPEVRDRMISIYSIIDRLPAAGD